MEKEGITNIALNPRSGKLVLKFNNNQQKTIEDDNLTDEQKKIKEFMQQIGKNDLSQNQIREEVQKAGKNSNNSWLGPVVIIAIVALVAIFIGVIIYKNKKKNY